MKRAPITVEYATWISLKQRCLNPKNPSYKNYGKRGITVCDRWLNSFENFIADMGLRPAGRYTIERKDVNAGYSPDNCTWDTYAAQNRNLRTNRVLELNGRRQCLIDWAGETGIHWSTIWHRIQEGWSVEKALTVATNSKYDSMCIARSKLVNTVHAFGLALNVKEWSIRTGLSRNCIFSRLKRGMSPEQALSAPSQKGGLGVRAKRKEVD